MGAEGRINRASPFFQSGGAAPPPLVRAGEAPSAADGWAMRNDDPNATTSTQRVPSPEGRSGGCCALRLTAPGADRAAVRAGPPRRARGLSAGDGGPPWSAHAGVVRGGHQRLVTGKAAASAWSSKAAEPAEPVAAGAGEELHTGKYHSLWDGCVTSPGERIRVTFAEIEEIIGLPFRRRVGSTRPTGGRTRRAPSRGRSRTPAGPLPA
jgi:hypothetical protein